MAATLLYSTSSTRRGACMRPDTCVRAIVHTPLNSPRHLLNTKPAAGPGADPVRAGAPQRRQRPRAVQWQDRHVRDAGGVRRVAGRPVVRGGAGQAAGADAAHAPGGWDGATPHRMRGAGPTGVGLNCDQCLLRYPRQRAFSAPPGTHRPRLRDPAGRRRRAPPNTLSNCLPPPQPEPSCPWRAVPRPEQVQGPPQARGVRPGGHHV